MDPVIFLWLIAIALLVAGVAPDASAARERAGHALSGGTALAKFREIVQA